METLGNILLTVAIAAVLHYWAGFEWLTVAVILLYIDNILRSFIRVRQIKDASAYITETFNTLSIDYFEFKTAIENADYASDHELQDLKRDFYELKNELKAETDMLFTGAGNKSKRISNLEKRIATLEGK